MTNDTTTIIFCKQWDSHDHAAGQQWNQTLGPTDPPDEPSEYLEERQLMQIRCNTNLLKKCKKKNNWLNDKKKLKGHLY